MVITVDAYGDQDCHISEDIILMHIRLPIIHSQLSVLCNDVGCQKC